MLDGFQAAEQLADAGERLRTLPEDVPGSRQYLMVFACFRLLLHIDRQFPESYRWYICTVTPKKLDKQLIILLVSLYLVFLGHYVLSQGASWSVFRSRALGPLSVLQMISDPCLAIPHKK